MKTKIMITIEGGNIQHIATNSENLEVTIVDIDNDEGYEVFNYIPDTLSNDFTKNVKPSIANQIEKL